MTDALPRDPDAPVAVFYNGACPVCRPEIRHYAQMARRRGIAFDWVDIAEDPHALAAHGVDPWGAYRRLHAIGPDGELHAGVPAFRILWARLPYYRRLAALTGRPAVGRVASWAYDRVLAPLISARFRKDADAAARAGRPVHAGDTAEV